MPLRSLAQLPAIPSAVDPNVVERAGPRATRWSALPDERTLSPWGRSAWSPCGSDVGTPPTHRSQMGNRRDGAQAAVALALLQPRAEPPVGTGTGRTCLW